MQTIRELIEELQALPEYMKDRPVNENINIKLVETLSSGARTETQKVSLVGGVIDDAIDYACINDHSSLSLEDSLMRYNTINK